MKESLPQITKEGGPTNKLPKSRKQNFLKREMEFELNEYYNLKNDLKKQVDYENLKAVNERYDSLFENKIFDAEEELSRIRQMSTEDKERALPIFKEKLYTQQEGILFVSKKILSLISKNFEASKDFQELNISAKNTEEIENKESDQEKKLKYKNSKLEALKGQINIYIKHYSHKYRFSEKQQKCLYRIHEKFVHRTIAIDSFLQKFPKGEDAYREILGVQPNGEVKVFRGLFSIAFDIKKIEDYALFSKRPRGMSHDSLSLIDIENAQNSGGRFTHFKPRNYPDLAKAIILINSSEDDSDVVGKEHFKESIIKHEDQHALNRMIYDSIMPNQENFYQSGIDSIQSKEECIELLKQRLHHYMIDVEHRIRDEIIAYSKGGTDNYRTISYLTETKDKKGLYDYLDIENDVVERSRNVINGKYKMSEEEIKSVLKSEYRKVVEGAVLALNKALKKGHTLSALLPFLLEKRIFLWERFLKKL